MSIVANPIGGSTIEPATNVLRAELQGPDRTKVNSTATATPRSEVLTNTIKSSNTANTDESYGFTLGLDSNFAFSTNSDNWVSVAQWKGDNGGQPPLALEVRSTASGTYPNHLWLHRRTGTEVACASDPSQTCYSDNAAYDLGAVPYTVWTRLVFNIHWAADNTGSICVGRDGYSACVTGIKTLQTISRNGNPAAPDPVYFKQGLYRSTAWTQTQVAYFGPTTIATTPEEAGWVPAA